MVAISTSGLVGSHHLFSKLDKTNIESIITTYIESYQEMYYKEFKKKKLKNIIIGFFSVPVFYVAIFFLNGGLDDLRLSPESKFSYRLLWLNFSYYTPNKEKDSFLYTFAGFFVCVNPYFLKSIWKENPKSFYAKK